MAWTLNDTTLPNPNRISHKYVTKSTYHEMINGASKRDVSNIKDQWALTFTAKDQDTAIEMKALFLALETAGVTTYVFQGSQGSLVIPARDVHLDITSVEYNLPGGEFREDFTMLLTDAT